MIALLRVRAKSNRDESGIGYERINKYYFWNLIPVDPDDNQFVDCAIAANAHFICTEDKHFNVLANVPFPTVSVISTKDFILLLHKKDEQRIQ